MSEVLTDAPERRVFALRERPEVIRLLHTAWNKVVRRDILTDLGIGFADGWYEDVSFTYPLLMSAERISVLDRVCVNYRQRLSGAITGTPSARHFEIFEHWQRVHDHLEGLGAAGEPLRPYLFERMIWHYLIVLGNGRRVPAALRRAFFERIVADYRRRLPPGGYPVASRADQLKHRLVAAGQWHTFAALRVAGRAGARPAPDPRDRPARPDPAAARVLPRPAPAPDRAGPGDLQRLLVPRLRLQPGRHPRQAARTRPRRPRPLGRPPRPRRRAARATSTT